MNNFNDKYLEIRSEFKTQEKNGISFVYDPKILTSGATHGFTKRVGGVSSPPFESLNFGFTRPEPREIVTQNYKLLSAAAGFDFSKMALVNYEHGNNVVVAKSEDALRGISPDIPAFEPCDGLITNDRELILTTLHADCMAVFLFDPVKKISAMLHSGWRGTITQIGLVAIQKMVKNFGSNPSDILVAVSPCISQKYFEVESDVAKRFCETFCDLCSVEFVYQSPTTQKHHIDLKKLMAFQLFKGGIVPQNLNMSNQCTFEFPEEYFSYRRNGKNAGAMAGFIKIV